MSIQRISTNHALAQRLDTLLGTKLAQQLATSTRPTTQDFIPQAARALPLEGSPHAPERPPGPPPETPQQAARQPLSQQARTAPSTTDLTRGPAKLQLADLPGTPSAPISLGGTAQLLVQLLRQFPSPLPPLTQAQALLPSPPPAQTTPNAPLSTQALPGLLSFSSPVAAALFQSLTQAVGQSGLFYESHLAQYAAGRYSRAQLSMEPQARQPGSLAPEPAPANDSSAERTARATRTDTELSSPSASTASESRSANAGPMQNLSTDAALLVRQQLETLALQALHWRGEAWPQTDMKWDVSRDGAQQENDEAAQQWSSQLTLTLPKLGEIQVRLHLAGQALSIQLAAPESEETLNAQAPALRQQLLATGLSLQQLRISPAFDHAAPGVSAEGQPEEDTTR